MIMATVTQLNIAKKKLFDVIGDDFKVYLQCMKNWFQQKMTKEEFDIEARKFLTSDTVHLHNDFLLAILNKCQSLCSVHSVKDCNGSSHIQSKDKQKKGKVKKKSRPVRATFEHRFQPASVAHYASQAVAKDAQEDNRLAFCARDGTLPDVAMVHGRMFVTAWDCGLDGVEDDAVRLMMLAVQNQLKTILMTVLSRRNAYRTREGKFQYAVGSPPVNPYLKNSHRIYMYTSNSNATSISAVGDHVPSIRPTTDWAEGEAALEMSCDIAETQNLPPVSAEDLYDALQVHRSSIASHTVYAINLERTITKLWHPSIEELEQEGIHQQEEYLRDHLEAERMVLFD